MKHQNKQESQKTDFIDTQKSNLNEKVLYFDCQSGISGDMSVAALLGLGIDRKEFQERLSLLRMKHCHIEITSKTICETEAVDFRVILTRTEDHHRSFEDVVTIFKESDLLPEEKDLARMIFEVIAKAESIVHGVPVKSIHFHEVGSADSIMDIAAVAICITMLNPHRIISSRIPLGTGHITCAHGVIPVPVPATVEILKGIPVYQTETRGELVTPTGAAIITSLAQDFGPMPPLEIQAVGYGAGKKKYDRTNLLRVLLGNPVSA